MKLLKQFALIFICLFAILPSTSAYAQDQAAATSLTSLLQNLQTMQANFQQTIQDGRGNMLQQSQGKMDLQRPGLFRWETTQPNQQLIIADGKFIWIYDKDLQQVTKQKQITSANAPGLLLSDSVTHLAQRFNIRSLSSSDNNQQFSLTPKSDQDLFKSVQLTFDNGVLNQMVLHDNIGQTTQIQFTQVNNNLNLSRRLFQFQAPAGVDVVTG